MEPTYSITHSPTSFKASYKTSLKAYSTQKHRKSLWSVAIRMSCILSFCEYLCFIYFITFNLAKFEKKSRNTKGDPKLIRSLKLNYAFAWSGDLYVLIRALANYYRLHIKPMLLDLILYTVPLKSSFIQHKWRTKAPVGAGHTTCLNISLSPTASCYKLMMMIYDLILAT